MAKRWKCARCSTENDEGVLTCSNCRMIRGGVVVPGTFSQPAAGPAPVENPVPGWPDAAAPQSAAEPQPALESSGLPEAAPEAGVDPVTAPPASRPLWRRIPIFWVIIGVVAVAGVITNASRSSTGEIDRRGDLTAADLRVGDCFDLKDPAADEIDEVTAGPCTTEHEYEMFFVGVMPEGPFPGDDAMTAFYQANCVVAFDAFVGKPYADSELEIFVLSPTQQAWSAGDRSIQCSAYHPRVHRVTKSWKGSGQ